MLFPMDVVALTRQLVDIESITGNEALIGDVVHSELLRLGYQANKLPVEGSRRNVYATSPEQPKPAIVFSTHMDTVPPFIPSSEDATRIYGRGSCDAKGIIAAQIAAAERLRAEGIYVGLLFLVGEERNSLGAQVANKQSPGCKFLVNGEPTENRMASASKGTLRVNVIAEGRMAHSAYPELGESAIDKLLEALNRLRAMKLPCEEGIGPCTLNIGMIEGGRAPNVIPDKAKAHLLYRLVGPTDELRRKIEQSVARPGQGRIHLGDPIPPLAHAGRTAHHGRRLHHRHSRAHQLGRTAADRSGIDPRRPHRGRVHREKAIDRRSGFVLLDCEKAGRYPDTSLTRMPYSTYNSAARNCVLR